MIEGDSFAEEVATAVVVCVVVVCVDTMEELVAIAE
jgi:hypothetical protein